MQILHYQSAAMEPPSTDLTQTQSGAQPNVITLKTRSEIDILDDGYSWKKYGQKYIKGSPYQRFYFKCRRGGCSVKKRSERCGDDPQFVLTTYQGTHNHEPDNKPPSASSDSTALRNSYDLRTQFLQSSETGETSGQRKN